MNKGMIFSHEMKFFIEKFGRYQLKTVSLHRFPRKVLMIGLWCNGSTTGFGSVCPGSNPGSPTRKSPVNNVCGTFSFLCNSYYSSIYYRLCCTIRAPAGTSSVTQRFAPIVTPLPMVTRHKMVALE